MLAILFTSVAIQSGTKNIGFLLVYASSLVLSYVLFHNLLCQNSLTQPSATEAGSGTFGNLANRFADGLFLVCTVYIFLHFAYLGRVPVIAGALSDDYFEIMRIRQNVFHDAPAVFRYPPNFILKSLLPFLLLYYFVEGRIKPFWTSVGLATFYGLALMNKLFVVTPYVPLFLYLILNRHFLLAVAMAMIPVTFLALLVFVQNPHVRPQLWTPTGEATASSKPLILEIPSAQNALQVRLATQVAQPQKVAPEAFLMSEPTHSPSIQFLKTVYLRVFVVPGQVISAWFTNIPKELPYANGCGYRWLAALRGCEFQFYPALVHDIENPRLVEEGVHGTMTAASFMEDYANFGTKGLIFGGVLLAFVLALITRLFAENWRWALILNFTPIAMILELPLSTVLLSGGWALTLLLYPIFRTQLHSQRCHSTGQAAPPGQS